MDRHVALRRDPAHLPEPGRRHVLPQRPARNRRRRGLRGEHHLQAPVEPRGRDDRRAGPGGPAGSARRRSRPAGGRRRQGADHHRRSGGLSQSHAAVGRRGLASRSPVGGSRVPCRHRGRHRADPRPAVRGRSPQGSQARHPAGAEHAGADQRADLRRLRRLRPEEQLPVRAADRHLLRPQDPDRPDVVQPGLLVPRRRLPVVHDRVGARPAAKCRPGEARTAATGPYGRHWEHRASRAADGPARSGPAHRPRRSVVAHVRDRRHGRRDGEPGAGHRRDVRRIRGARTRSDRPVAEGRHSGGRSAAATPRRPGHGTPGHGPSRRDPGVRPAGGSV